MSFDSIIEHNSLPSVSYISVVPDAINVSAELSFTSSFASCASCITFTIYGENIARVTTKASNIINNTSLLINLRLLFFLDNFFLAINLNPYEYHYL